ncbi:unnamed protein product [Urochloa humidicola]
MTGSVACKTCKLCELVCHYTANHVICFFLLDLGAILRHAYTVLQEYSNVPVQGYNTLFVFVLPGLSEWSSLSCILFFYLYGMYVPDWGYQISGGSIEKSFSVKCGVKGDTAPACNAVGMVGFRDRPSLQTLCLRAYKETPEKNHQLADPFFQHVSGLLN